MIFKKENSFAIKFNFLVKKYHFIMITKERQQTAPSTGKRVLKFFISVGLCLLVGFLAGYATQSSVNTWYTTLQKPSFNPPNWLFAPVWTTLYFLMGLAFFLVWNKERNTPKRRTAMTLFLIQLFFNAMWSVAFFMMQSPLWGLVDISILFLLIILTIFAFFRVSRLGGVLLIPYLLWVGFAAILNYTILILN